MRRGPRPGRYIGWHCWIYAAKYTATCSASTAETKVQCPNISTSLLRPTAAPQRGRGQRLRLQLITRHSSLIANPPTATLDEDVASDEPWVSEGP